MWGTLFVVVGYAAGASYHQVEKQVGRGLAIGLAVIVVGGLVAWRVNEMRAEREGAES